MTVLERFYHRIALLGMAACIALSAPSARADALIDGARKCTQYFPRFEQKYQVPTHLLSAVSLTESGRYHQGLGMAIPWPWTINAEGQGAYFDSKAEAVAAVKRLRASGVKSIDVGCMQVNLVHHADAFASLEEAFDPESNIAYASKFLSQNYDETRSWKQAVAIYHSRTPERGSDYAKRVLSGYKTIVTKLANARGGAPVMDASFTAGASPEVMKRKSSKLIIVHNDAEQKKAGKNYVRVIRPAGYQSAKAESVYNAAAPETPAEAAPAASQQASEPRILRLRGVNYAKSNATVSTRSGGTKFVFEN